MTWAELLKLYFDGIRLRIPMRSTAIEHIVYYPSTGKLDVFMTDGSDWPYPSPGNPPITPEKVLEWHNAPSQGKYYNFEVRGQW